MLETLHSTKSVGLWVALAAKLNSFAKESGLVQRVSWHLMVTNVSKTMQSAANLAYAIPDHPWIDSADGAAVRIAMTVAAPGLADGILAKVIAEQAREDGENEVTLSRSGGVLAANLQIGADLTSCGQLQANMKISCPGVKLHGAGFIVTNEEASQLGLGKIPGIEKHIRGYRNGKDLTNRPRDVQLIDLFGLNEDAAASLYPSLYQHVLIHVKPERDQNNRDSYRLNWWIFGEPRRDFRPALTGLPRYIATVETSKHCFFTFLNQEILPDNMLIAVASADAFNLGILSSNVHVIWALSTGGTLEDRPRYNKTRCFETFPFPVLENGPLKQRIRDIGERVDAHRKRQQELYPDLTLTGIYNVLEKLRGGDHGSPRSSHSGDGSSPPQSPLTEKDKEIHDKGRVSILKQIHDELDAAVLEAYGWQDLLVKGPPCSGGLRPSLANEEAPALSRLGIDAHRAPLQSGPAAIPIADILARGGPVGEALEQQLLTRLVALNHERAAEEKRGLIRWLRPDYQAPGAASDGHRPPLQSKITLPDDEEATPSIAVALAWPETMAEQVVAVRKLLTSVGHDAERLAACFGRKSQKRSAQITAILDTLRALDSSANRSSCGFHSSVSIALRKFTGALGG